MVLSLRNVNNPMMESARVAAVLLCVLKGE
jgi:hypothetical protein